MRYPLIITGTAVALLALTACTATPSSAPADSREPAASTAPPASDDPRVAEIADLVDATVSEYALKSAIVQVLVDGKELTTVVVGESTTGVPATADMHFRNGAVAISYVVAVLLQLVDDGTVSLDDTIDEWLPELPNADAVTLRMLVNMTSGYADHVADQDFLDSFVADPFQHWTSDDLIGFSLATPHLFEPGTNWDYSHAGYVILGEALTAATGKPMSRLLDELIIEPLELDGTVGDQGPLIPEPVQHAFTAERGVWEDSTYWDPSWTLPDGAVQTTTISDMARSFDAIVGAGELLSPESYEAMVAPSLVGFGSPLEGCRTCHELTEEWNYGLGVVRSENWLLQTPAFGGYAGAVATLPSERITVAASVTYTEASQTDWPGILSNRADDLVRRIATLLSPDDAPTASRADG